MDNRLAPKWDTSLAIKRRKYKVIKTEDFECYQRLICHYDDELRKYKEFLNELRKDTEHSDFLINEFIRKRIDEFLANNKPYQEEVEECLNTNVLDVVKNGGTEQQ